MGFRDLFTKRVQEHQEVAEAEQEQKRQEATVRQGVQAQVDPMVKALVAEVFETLSASKWPSIPVIERPGVKAYALGSFHSYHSDSEWRNAEAVVDSQGHIAFYHSCKTIGRWPETITAVSTNPLEGVYESLLDSVQQADEPGRYPISINSDGTLMYCHSSGSDYRDNPIYTYKPLDEYLANLAARTVSG